MKLTLNIEPGLIDQIKEVAKRKNTSVSKLAESFFKKEVEIEHKSFQMKSKEELPEWIKQLTISTGPTPDFDHKAEYGKHLEEKYGL
jgi:cell division protein ZapA (FtsZ GTPase activity inhibitor)